jgi:hypothetical protein
MNRRNFILGSGVALATSSGFSLTKPGSAQAPAADISLVSELPPLPTDLASQADQPPAPYSEIAPVGTARPSDDEMKKANEILLQSPFGAPPVEIAQYLLAVGAGAYGRDYRAFVREWPVRANPMIFHFFSSTLTKPEGDVTPWCAAFVNWCLLRSHATSADEIGKSPGGFSINGKPFPDQNLQQFSTNSAASGSFRCWQEIATPKRGDIAVFKNPGTDALTAACLGQGHVAFFLSVPRPGWARVLGGNQTDPGSGGAITIADMRTSSVSRFMKYVAIK